MVKDNKRKPCLQIVLLVPTDNNISVKEYYKISQFKDMENEVEKLYHLKTTTLPVIVGALGMIKKRTDKHIYKITGHSQPIQKIALCGTAHLLRRILSIRLKKKATENLKK